MNIAVIGASGVVGNRLVQVLDKSKYANGNFFLYASKKSAGKEISIKGKQYTIMELNQSNLDRQLDCAIFCVKNQISGAYAPILAERGIFCVDNSSYFRMTMPLIVPEVNADNIEGNLIANPNCTAIPTSIALAPLIKYGLTNVVVSTYQAISGAGQGALQDFYNHTNHTTPYSYNDNCIARIGEITDNNFSIEENKLMNEARRILNIPNLNISCQSVRVPVPNCHSLSIYCQLRDNFDLNQIADSYRNATNVIYYSDNIPLPTLVTNNAKIHISRLRQVPNSNAIMMWVVSDNILKGASYNAWQIVLKKYYGVIDDEIF